jgi:hypothetical protein
MRTSQSNDARHITNTRHKPEYKGMKKSIHNFTFALTPDNSAGGDGTKISGVAYSGGMLPSYGWLGDCAIDLSSITVPDSVPLLVDHEAEVGSVAGRVVPTVSGGHLSINGEIFADVPSGDLVKKLLDRGFSGSAYGLRSLVGLLIPGRSPVRFFGEHGS